jgi:hypothetical protein
MRKTSILLGIFALLLTISLVLVSFEYSNVLSLRSEISKRETLLNQFNSTVDQLSEGDELISQLNSTIEQRDTLIMQLDTALNLTQSRLSLKLQNASQYLTTPPNSNNEGNLTKIFLESAAAWYHYEPAYPFNISWFNTTTHYGSSQQMIPLTDNRSISLSFFGWTIGDNANYEYEGIGGDPYLMIGVKIRNDYTSADAGNGSDPNAPIGNSTAFSRSLYQVTSQYVSFVNLTVKLVSENGSIIPADTLGIQSPTARGGEYFPLGSGETKQVVFYLYPSSLNIEGFEIYVSYLSSVSPFA